VTNKSKRPIYAIKLTPLPRGRDPIKALRAALKRLLRWHKLRCVGITEQIEEYDERDSP
jgi:hypothetical protein